VAVAGEHDIVPVAVGYYIAATAGPDAVVTPRPFMV